MGRNPCCEKLGLKKGPWTPEEDRLLTQYIQKNGHGSWHALPKQAGLLRCGKSCRLRWINYLRPDIKRGSFAPEEERTIIQLHAILGNKWSSIAAQMPGRTDNEVKNFWNTHLKKKLLRMGLDPSTHAPTSEGSKDMRHMSQWEIARLEAEARFSSSLSSNNKLYAPDNKDSNSHGKPPSDIFLKLWNSEAGKAFRNESTNDTIPDHGKKFSWTETNPQRTFTSVSSFCSACRSDKLNCDHSFNDPTGSNHKEHCLHSLEDHHNSDDWIQGESCNAHIGQEHEIGFSDLILDISNRNSTPNNNNSNPHISSIECVITELSTNFQQQSAWPWTELQLDEDKDYWSCI